MQLESVPELDLLRLDIQTALPVVKEDYDRDWPIENHIRILAEGPEGDEVEVGEAGVSEFELVYAPGDEEEHRDNFVVMDGVSQETCRVHEALVAHFDEVTEIGVTGLVYLRKIDIKPQYQGRGIGGRVLRTLLHHWGRHAGWPSHMFLLCHPLDPQRDEGARWPDRDPEGFEKQAARLRSFYERWGFHRLGETDVMVFDLAYEAPS